MSQYGDNNLKYLSAVLSEVRDRGEARIRWLVDASKDPYRLFWLKRSGLFDIRVIHLIKDPRAYVHSMTRDSSGGLPYVRFAGRWVLENLMIRRLCRASFGPRQVVRLRYEDLASRPHEVLRDLCAWLDLEYAPDLAEGFREYENHAVSGNPMRWQDEGIRLDEAWRSALPKAAARLVWAVTWPLARAWGYR